MGWSEEQRCRTDPSDLVGVPGHNIGIVVRISQREIPMRVIFVRVFNAVLFSSSELLRESGCLILLFSKRVFRLSMSKYYYCSSISSIAELVRVEFSFYTQGNRIFCVLMSLLVFLFLCGFDIFLST